VVEQLLPNGFGQDIGWGGEEHSLLERLNDGGRISAHGHSSLHGGKPRLVLL
jgi:hypothetical protein